MKTFEEVYAALAAAGTEQNRKIYRRHGAGDNLFGVSFANLKAFKKQVVSPEGRKGMNHSLAELLWETGNSDACTLACMIADPSKLTSQDAEQWVKVIRYHTIADYFSELVSRTSFVDSKIESWTKSKAEYIRRSGYSLLAQAALNDESRSDSYFETYIEQCERELQISPNRAKQAMNNCLIAVGSRNDNLRKRVIQASRKIGQVEIDHGDTACQTLVIEDYLEKMDTRKKKKPTRC